MLKEFSSILINKDSSVIDAMKQLDKTAEKILFVIDEDSKLVGSLSDGDIRRWILKGGGLKDNVERACFKNTFYVEINYDLEKVKEEILTRKIVYVPVVDRAKIIVEFLIWDKLFDGKIKRKVKEKITIPVVIMAGGKGTRLDPFTKILPKPLIPIGEKTILEMIIDKFRDFNADHFYISINHKANIIKSYFKDLKPEYKITFLQEKKPLGTIGGIKQLENKINGNILVTNCDVIIEADYGDLLKHHVKEDNDITIVTSVKQYRIPYGVCEIESGGKLIKIKEKPEFNILVNTGMYIMKSGVFKLIPENKYFDVTSLIDKVKCNKGKVCIYPVSEEAWIDIGEWVEYKKAIERFRI